MADFSTSFPLFIIVQQFSTYFVDIKISKQIYKIINSHNYFFLIFN
jgi:hypothetical protein